MKKLTEVLTDPKGHQYYFAQVSFKEVELSEYAFKMERGDLIEYLIRDIERQWLLEPITLYEDDKGKVWLAGGKHRLAAARSHDDRYPEDPLRWMEEPVDAKVYVGLAPVRIPDIVMSLDDVRKKAAAGERQSGLARSFEAARESLIAQGKPADEVAVLNEMGYARGRAGARGRPPTGAIRTIILSFQIQQLLEVSKDLAGVVTQKQVPRRSLESKIASKEYPLITRENLGFALAHLVRDNPVNEAEFKGPVNPRETEFENLRVALEHFVDLVLKPLADDDAGQAIAMCRRHPIEAVGQYMAAVLVRLYGLPNEDPLAQREIEDWTVFDAYLKRLKDFNWDDPVVQSTRSGNAIYRGVPGEFEGVREFIDEELPELKAARAAGGPR